MLAKNEKKAGERYRSFVESALGEETESPLKKVYGGVILGGEGFTRNILLRLENERLGQTEVSHRRALQAITGMQEIIAAICEYYGITWEEIKKNKRSEARKACIYLLKRYTGTSNSEIGELRCPVNSRHSRLKRPP